MAPASKINLKDHLEDGQLDLSMSELQEVPVKDIANIKKATSLDLSNNRLLSLGKNFTILTNIIKLDLSNNLIKELPDNFGEMKQLKHLDLYSNQLKHLPLSFCELKSLRWLDVKNNPLVPALATVAGPCLEAKQCQQCAVKVVAFMGKMQAKVEEEQQRRAAQRQKDLEKNEAAASAAAPISKTQQKKNKKANKVVEKPKVEISETVIKQNDKQVVEPPKVKIVKNKNVKTQEKPRPKSAFYKNFCYYTTFSIVLFVYMAFISCLFYPSVFDDAKELSSIVGESTMKHMPLFVVDFIKDYIAPAGIYIQMLLKDLNLKLFNLHETMYQNEFFKFMEDYIIEIWNNFKIILSDLFRTSVEVKE